MNVHRVTSPLVNFLKYRVERFVLRGAIYQLWFVALLIALISTGAGLFVYWWDGGFASPFEAIWWGFLRLSDPGYLGDDTGTARRVVSTFVTILGYVVFLGALVAIMTQWLTTTMRRLEAGMTPISRRGHILILGWSSRTPTIVREILSAGVRLKRFLKFNTASRVHVVILAEEVTARLRQELREELGPLFKTSQITFRSGVPQRIEDLQRVDFANAGVIVLPGHGAWKSGPETVDARTIKTIMTIASSARSQGFPKAPTLVTEIYDDRKIVMAEKAYRGVIETIPSDTVIGQQIAHNIRHPGLARVYSELVNHDRGVSFYLRECPALDGRPFAEVRFWFPNAIVLGILRSGEGKVPRFNPAADFVMQATDRYVVLSSSFEQASPSERPPALPEMPVPIKRRVNEGNDKKVLFMGWSSKFPKIVKELDQYRKCHYQLDVLSLANAEERKLYGEGYYQHTDRIEITHLEADYTIPSEVDHLHLGSYDFVCILADDYLANDQDADARSILAYLLIQERLLKAKKETPVLVELMDPDNEMLLRYRRGDVVVSRQVTSHILANIALRPELSHVFDELFDAGDTEVTFVSASDYQLEGSHSFGAIMEKVASYGEIAIGVKVPSGKKSGPLVRLNPDRKEVISLGPQAQIVVLVN